MVERNIVFFALLYTFFANARSPLGSKGNVLVSKIARLQKICVPMSLTFSPYSHQTFEKQVLKENKRQTSSKIGSCQKYALERPMVKQP